MTDLKDLNKIFDKSWKTEEEIDWVYVAKHMDPNLEFMIENIQYLRPYFVVENPKINVLERPYSTWIKIFGEKKIKQQEEPTDVLDYINKMIKSDSDFPEKHEFYSMGNMIVLDDGYDAGELYKGKAYLDGNIVISKEDSWENVKPILKNLLK